jgi:hypothetical protein
VSPMHTKPFSGTPYVALGLLLQKKLCMEKDHTVHAVFELSIYNHSDGMYCGAKGNLVNYSVSHTSILLQLGVYSSLCDKFEL